MSGIYLMHFKRLAQLQVKRERMSSVTSFLKMDPKRQYENYLPFSLSFFVHLLHLSSTAAAYACTEPLAQGSSLEM